MAFLQTRTDTAAPLAENLAGLPARLRAALARMAHRQGPSPEELLAAQARRTEARAAVDRLMRLPR